MKALFFIILSLSLVSCSDSDRSQSPLVQTVEVSQGIWMYEDEDATCYQLYSSSISCSGKPAIKGRKKAITKEAVEVANGIWKSENKNHICYQLYSSSLDCIPNLKED